MKKLFQKRNVILSAAVSISLCFTLFFFSPVDLFLANQKEFTVSAGHIIVPMLLFSLCTSAAVFLFNLILGAINRKCFNASISIFFGLLLAVYCQIMLFNGNMQVIDGEAANYSRTSAFNTFDLLVLYALAMTPLLLLFAKRHSNNEKLKFIGQKSFLFATALLIVMQAIGTGSLLLRHKIRNTSDSENYEYFSFEPILSVSKDNNIFVIILDRLDEEWMASTLERYPEMEGRLDGFTFYEDNISRYFSTYISVTQMLSGVEFSIEHRKDFMDYAWTQDSVPRKLKNNGYTVNALIDSTTTFSTFSNIRDCCFDNCRNADISYTYNYLGKNGILGTMLKFSAAKALPCYLKGLPLEELSFDFSNSFTYIDYSQLPDALRPVISDVSDHDFYNYLQDHKLTADSEKPCYSFIHLNGPHDVSEILAAQYKDNTYPADKESTIRGDFESIFTILEQLKQLGAYDNSTIIILGDHGKFRDVQDGDLIVENVNTGLLIKHRGATGAFTVDTTTQMSNQYLPASIMEYAGLDHSEYGYSFNDIIRDNIKTDRYTSLLGYEDTLYKITGSSLDFSNWEVISRDPNRKAEPFTKRK